MRLLLTIGLSLCLLSSIASQAMAQYQNPEWIEVSPAGESFHVSMPNTPKVETEKQGAVSGHRYIALTGVATYTLWSITNANYRTDQDTDAYLDATAELLWEGLLRAAREQLDEKARPLARMTYVRELPPEGLAGREYTLTVGEVTGTTEFFVAHEHIYVLLVMRKPGGDWSREKFFTSFRPSSDSPAPPKIASGGLGPGVQGVSPDPTDYNRSFTGREVTQKARVLEKAEPTYTESARKFGVEGRVVMRAVFTKNGEVTNLHVVSKLPHGLTQKAIEAARAIRFTPAVKDGQPVSMWMELQYNFHLY
ncbi:MAG TPA: energy transducer TonB [Pyrinomonadaceae bacterium]|nr:energy transducer TonB [Pyrinomonadaceae bacterium]